MDGEPTVDSSRRSRLAAVDQLSLVAALIFAAAGAVVLAGESLAETDPVILAGVALIAIGVARFVAVPVRSRARRRAAAVPPVDLPLESALTEDQQDEQLEDQHTGQDQRTGQDQHTGQPEPDPARAQAQDQNTES